MLAAHKELIHWIQGSCEGRLLPIGPIPCGTRGQTRFSTLSDSNPHCYDTLLHGAAAVFCARFARYFLACFVLSVLLLSMQSLLASF